MEGSPSRTKVGRFTHQVTSILNLPASSRASLLLRWIGVRRNITEHPHSPVGASLLAMAALQARLLGGHHLLLLLSQSREVAIAGAWVNVRQLRSLAEQFLTQGARGVFGFVHAAFLQLRHQ
jgi:hypothetical protein